MWDPRPYFTSKLNRLVRKNGRANLKFRGIPHKRKQFLKDIFTSLVQIEWRWNLLLFISGFVISWFSFAAYYFQMDFVWKVYVFSSEKPCIENVKSFASALLFSIETQTTIGYGYRHVTEACPHIFIVVMLQSILGLVTQAILAGIVIAKVKRGKHCCSAVFFSNTACVHEEDGHFFFTVRVADIRKSPTVICVHARALFLRKQYSESGHLPVGYCNMEMTGENGQSYLFTAWPTRIVHKINKQSPFWEMTRDDFLKVNFEVVVIVEGIISATGRPFRTCVSYLPWDISWGNRFVEFSFDSSNNFHVDYTYFHNTKAVKTPWLTPRDLHESQKRLRPPSRRRDAPMKILLEVPQNGPRQCRSEEALKTISSPALSVDNSIQQRHVISDTFLGPLPVKFQLK